MESEESNALAAQGQSCGSSNFEDHFSRQAPAYARHRPGYPAALFAYLASVAPARGLAWDAGTGSGQAAVGLASRFARVIATDPSAQQIAHAHRHDHISYCIAAERTDLAAQSVDLVTAAQALHWFDIDAFHAEARRVLKQYGVIAVWCYHLSEISPAIDRILSTYHTAIVGPYWPPRTQLVEEHFRTLSFPFDELQPPETFFAQADWNLPDLLGYLDTWSATQRFIEQRRHHPLDAIRAELAQEWGAPNAGRVIRWPLYMRVGRAT